MRNIKEINKDSLVKVNHFNPCSSTRNNRKYPGRFAKLMQSIDRVLREHNRQTHDGRKRCSLKTTHDRRQTIRASYRFLHEQGFGITDVKNTRRKHVQAVLNDWEARGLAAPTLQTYQSQLHVFLSWIGKGTIMNEVSFSDPDVNKRIYVAIEDKSLEAFELDTTEMLLKIFSEDERVGVQVMLMASFALRPREAWLLRPHRDDGGSVLNVISGTKGGRPRDLAINTENQRMIIELAKQYANTKNASTIQIEKSCKQWENHFYYICRKVGLTKALSGATPYGFRHGFLNDLYEAVAGYPSPVRGGPGKRLDPKADQRAREAVVKQAGHCRTQISNSYCGGSF